MPVQGAIVPPPLRRPDSDKNMEAVYGRGSGDVYKR